MTAVAWTPAEVASYWRSAYPELRQRGSQWRGKCPLHNGRRDSFAVNPETGMWCCYSECGRGGSMVDFQIEQSGGDFKLALESIRGIVGRGQPNGNPQRQQVASYVYEDEGGKPLYRVLRYFPKDFRQQRHTTGGWRWGLDDVRRVLYKLPEVVKAERVFVAEGEKDCDLFASWNLAATTNPGGAGKWRAEYSEFLRGKQIVIIPDADARGRGHALDVAESLLGVAGSVKVIELPSARDLSAWAEAGGNAVALARLVQDAEQLTKDSLKGLRAEWLPVQDAATETKTSKNASPQKDLLLELAATASLFRAPGGAAFADIDVNGHRETWPLRSGHFKAWLNRRYYERTGGAPGREVREVVLDTLQAKACFDAPERPVALRVAEHEGKLYLDLCDGSWRAVEIGQNGWRVVDCPPVRFRRTPGMKPLPVPVAGGSVDELRPFLNVDSDGEFVLTVAWILASLRPSGPFPALTLLGEQGSAKSTFANILRSLVDPSGVPLRSLPRNDRDLFIGANNAHIQAFDNVSGLQPWLSDSLCRLSTGGGFATRKLWSDGDETLFEASRPVLLNGIADVAIRPDLADRCLFLTLQPIPDERRRPEAELWADFDRARPSILGALFDAVSGGLRELPNTKLRLLPRMADFAKWVTACESTLWKPGTFIKAYTGNRADATQAVIDADTVSSAVVSLMTERADGWEGSSTELLDALARHAGERTAKSKYWPGSASVLSGRLRWAAPNLRRLGIEITRHRAGNQRTIRLVATAQGEPAHTDPAPPSLASLPSPDPVSGSPINSLAHDASGDDRIAGDATVTLPSLSKPLKTKVYDGNDANDGSAGTVLGGPPDGESVTAFPQAGGRGGLNS